MTIRDDILAVIHDSSRLDRFVEITCLDDPPCELILALEDRTRVQFRVPGGDVSVDEVIEKATAYLMANS